MSVRINLIIAVTALLLLGLTACEGGTLLDGIISDGAGHPIPSALVKLEVMGGNFSPDDGHSDANGNYKVSVIHYPKRTWLVVTVAKDGFEPFTKKFLSQGTSQHLNINLKPASVDVPAHQ